MSNKKELRLASRIESVDEAAQIADEYAKEHGFTEDNLFGVDLAVRESVANAVKHGNKFDESKIVVMKLDADDECLTITITDQGSGFKVDDIPDPTDQANILKASGRGVLFIRSFMSVVEWEDDPAGGTTVLMKKNR